MNLSAKIARYLLGLMFVVFGLNGFFHFIPLPPPASPLAHAFLMSLGASHYIMVVSFLQLVCGVLLLLDRFVPLALTILAAIIANILLYHLTMDPKGLAGGLLAAILWVLTFTKYRPSFATCSALGMNRSLVHRVALAARKESSDSPHSADAAKSDHAK